MIEDSNKIIVTYKCKSWIQEAIVIPIKNNLKTNSSNGTCGW